MDYFDFISDDKFRTILIRDYLELQICIEQKASKAVLILSGSIIEAVLLEYFIHNLPQNITEDKLLKWDLNDLIKEAVNTNLISTKTKDLSSVIRNYRNLIHPGKEIRSMEEFDHESAIVSYNLVKMVVKEVKENYLKKYGYRAEDIFNKIKTDRYADSIFDKLLNKTNQFEKNKLLDLLTDHQVQFRINNDLNERNLEKYFYKIKKQVSKEKIEEKLKLLLNEVESGKKELAMILFELYGNSLNIMSSEEKDLILEYVYDVVEIFRWDYGTLKYVGRNVYEKLGLYLDSREIKKKYFTMIINIVKDYKFIKDNNNNKFLNAYEELLNNLDEKQKKIIEEHIKNTLDKKEVEQFYKDYADKDELPF